MSAAAAAETAPPKPPRPLWWRILWWALLVVVIGAAANLLGWDLRGWFHSLWNTVTSISAASLIAAILLMIVQTSATAFAWYSILHYAYPERTKWRDILAGYAVSVALNGILPANIGTLVFLIMVTVLLGIGFAAVLGAYAVEKIFFTCSGTFVYLYLFLSVGGSFDISFSWVHEHWPATIIVFGGGILMIVCWAAASGRMSSPGGRTRRRAARSSAVPAGSSAASSFRRSSAGAPCSRRSASSSTPTASRSASTR
jgi:hypothetical protein